MTVYRVQGPDGQVHEFEGPDGASEQQVMQIAQSQFDPNTAKPVSTFDPNTAQPVDAAQEARQRGVKAGEDESSIGAAIGQFAHQATFGLQPLADAAAQYARDRLTGKENAPSFSEDLAEARGRSEGEIGGHQAAGTVGGVLGGIAGGKGVGGLLKGTRIGELVAAVPGQKVANVAKSAATGAAIGGGTALANGDNLPDAARTASISALATPLVSKGATFLISKLQPAAARAYQTLADTIGETPQTLQSAYNAFQQLTGRLPSMAELVGLKSQGKLRQLAMANSEIGDAAITAARFGSAPLHEQLAAAHNHSFPQTAASQAARRDAVMTAAMSDVNPATGLALRDHPIDLTPGSKAHSVLTHPIVTEALGNNTRLLGNDSIQARIDDNKLTLNDLDSVREALRSFQDRYANLDNPSHDRFIAREFGDVAQKVEGVGRAQHPAYGDALDDYRVASRYTDAFEHGLGGRAAADAPNSQLARTLQTSEGQAGYQHGNALYRAQQALNAIAPGGVRPAQQMDASHVAQAAMAAGSSGPGVVYHAMRAIPGLHLSEPVQRIIAQQLFDSRTTQQGINNLVRAGAQAKDIRTLGAAIGGVAGQRIADYVSQQGQ